MNVLPANFKRSVTLIALALTVSAHANPSVPPTKCPGFLEYRSKTRSFVVVNTGWERLLEVMDLTQDSAQLVRRIVNFTVAALGARAQSNALTNLTDPLLDEQARGLLHQQDEILSAWPKLLQSSPEIIAKSRRVLTALKELNTTLHSLIDQQIHLPWSTVYQMTILTGAIEEQTKIEFRVDKGEELEVTFRELFGYEFTEDLSLVRQWAIQLRTNVTAELDVRLMQRFLDEASYRFNISGIVTVPLARVLSRNEALTVGFLPIHLVQLDLHKGRPQPHWLKLNSPGTACRDMIWYDLADITPKNEYHVTGLCQPLPKDWSAAINASWHNWFAALGGFDAGTTPTPLTPGLVKEILYATRYVPDLDMDQGPQWMDTEKLIQWFFTDYFFTNDEDTLIKPSVARDFQDYARQLLGDLIPGSMLFRIDEGVMTSALDLLIQRLYLASGESIKDPALRYLLEQVPTSPVTVKLLVLRTLMTNKSPPPKGFSGPF